MLASSLRGAGAGAARHGAHTTSAATSATPRRAATAHGSARRHAGTRRRGGRRRCAAVTPRPSRSGGASASSSSSRASPMSLRRRFGSFSRQRRSSRRSGAGRSAGSACQFTSSLSTLASVIEMSSPSNARRPRQHLVEHDAKGPDVGALDRPALPRACSGRHVGGRAEDHAHLRRAAGQRRRVHRVRARRAGRIQRFGETEVEHLHRAVGADFDVRGLQIAMDDALLVRGFERVGDLLRDRQRLGERRSGRARCARTDPRPRPVPSRAP